MSEIAEPDLRGGEPRPCLSIPWHVREILAKPACGSSDHARLRRLGEVGIVPTREQGEAQVPRLCTRARNLLLEIRNLLSGLQPRRTAGRVNSGMEAEIVSSRDDRRYANRQDRGCQYGLQRRKPRPS